MSRGRVLYCHCAYAQVLSADARRDVLAALARSGLEFVAVPDLCEMSARGDPALAEVTQGPATVVACHGRAVKWLFEAAGAPLPADAQVLNLREQTAQEVVGALARGGVECSCTEPEPATGAVVGEYAHPTATAATDGLHPGPPPRSTAGAGEGAAPTRLRIVVDQTAADQRPEGLAELLVAGYALTVSVEPQAVAPLAGERLLVLTTLDQPVVEAERARVELGLPKPGTWKPWFPVIDFDRCTNCMQCLSFCLFGVYAVEQGKLRVANPAACKADCPACSRVCPQVAILFPKYRHAPINGAEVTAEDAAREKVKVDVSALLGGDVYATLRERSQRAGPRFSRERDEATALAERKRYLAQLQEDLGIPPGLIESLPSIEEMRAKLERK